MTYDKRLSDLGVYNTSLWKKIRQVALQRDGGLCRCCLHYGLITPAKIVHHIHPITLENYNDPSIVYNLENLVSVCEDCHALIHNHTLHTRYKLDDDGEIIDCIDRDEINFYTNFLK